MAVQLQITIERDEHGYSVFCPQVTSAQFHGESLEDVMDQLRRAINLYWGTLPTEEEDEPPPREPYEEGTA